jgi:hypothetical protein
VGGISGVIVKVTLNRGPKMARESIITIQVEGTKETGSRILEKGKVF